MQTSKKKPSAVFIVTGALLAAYLGYLIGGAWSDGQNLMIFMESFNQVCQKPFANYFNDNTVKSTAIALGIYNQKTFDDTRKKMKKLLEVSVLSVVVFMGIAFAYKYGYIDKFMQMLGNKK